MRGVVRPRTARVASSLRRSLVRWLPRSQSHRVTLAYGDHEFQRLQLYLPAARAFPVVVCVYGSYWHSRSDNRWMPIGAMLRDHGFGAVVMRHRLHPPDKWPAQIEDVAAAIAWTQTFVGSLGGDASRVALVGHSSGAQLALLVALDHRFLEARGVKPHVVRAITALGPPTDLVPRGDAAGCGKLLVESGAIEVFSRDLEVMRSASPCMHVRTGLPPVQLVVGERDIPEIATDVEQFRAQYERAGNQATVVRVRDRDHMGLVAAFSEDEPLRRDVLQFLDEQFLDPATNR